MKMQGFRNYALEMVQHSREQQIVVDLMPPQYTKPSPPPTPPTSGKKTKKNMFKYFLNFIRKLNHFLLLVYGIRDFRFSFLVSSVQHHLNNVSSVLSHATKIQDTIMYLTRQLTCIHYINGSPFP